MAPGNTHRLVGIGWRIAIEGDLYEHLQAIGATQPLRRRRAHHAIAEQDLGREFVLTLSPS